MASSYGREFRVLPYARARKAMGKGLAMGAAMSKLFAAASHEKKVNFHVDLDLTSAGAG